MEDQKLKFVLGEVSLLYDKKRETGSDRMKKEDKIIKCVVITQ
jgi:hypothetical protein